MSGNNYVSRLVQKEGELCELLWNEGGDTFRQALIGVRSFKSGINALVLAAIGGSEAVVRGLHKAGVSATETYEDGQSVADWVQKRAPALAPVIEELAALEPP